MRFVVEGRQKCPHPKISSPLSHALSHSHLQHKQDFPLFTQAVKLFDYRDAMVRTSVRNLTLMVFKGEKKRKVA